MLRRILIAGSAALLVAGCTLRTEMPALPPMNFPAMPAMTACHEIEPLKDPPKLPYAKSSPCPIASGLYTCFDKANSDAAALQFAWLVTDRDYCRVEYEKARRGSR